MKVKDNHGRSFSYLRLSLTPLCNFRCQYCLPDGNPKVTLPPLMTPDEIENLVAGCADAGFWKVRLTGGEPTLRRDFLEIAQRVGKVRGIRTLALTTNAYKLHKEVADYRLSGITHLNVSVDSLDPETFRRITGADRLPGILSGLDQALGMGFESIKLNMVLLKGLNDHELPEVMEWVKDKPVSFRFIELMPTHDNKDFFTDRYRNLASVRDPLLEQGWRPVARQTGAGPADYLVHPEYRGRLGFIRPSEAHFCDSCNRLRVSAEGRLKLCLFGDEGVSLRPWLHRRSQGTELGSVLRKLVNGKKPGHELNEGKYGERRNLAEVGG